MTPSPILFAAADRHTLNSISGDALLVLPVGATEQHGSHLPTGTDAIHVEHLAIKAAERASSAVSVVVAPTLFFGISNHHLPFGATLSLNPATLGSILIDIAHSAAQSGFRRLFVLNGHGGNHHAVQASVPEISQTTDMHVSAGSWWEIAKQGLEEVGAHAVSRVPGHAGAFETSLMRVLTPDLVGEIPRDSQPEVFSGNPSHAIGFVEEHPGVWAKSSGHSDDPNRGSTDAGQRYLEVAVSAVSSAFLDFYSRTKKDGEG